MKLRYDFNATQKTYRTFPQKVVQSTGLADRWSILKWCCPFCLESPRRSSSRKSSVPVIRITRPRSPDSSDEEGEHPEQQQQPQQQQEEEGRGADSAGTGGRSRRDSAESGGTIGSIGSGDPIITKSPKASGEERDVEDAGSIGSVDRGDRSSIHSKDSIRSKESVKSKSSVKMKEKAKSSPRKSSSRESLRHSSRESLRDRASDGEKTESPMKKMIRHLIRTDSSSHSDPPTSQSMNLGNKRGRDQALSRSYEEGGKGSFSSYEAHRKKAATLDHDRGGRQGRGGGGGRGGKSRTIEGHMSGGRGVINQSPVEIRRGNREMTAAQDGRKKNREMSMLDNEADDDDDRGRQASRYISSTSWDPSPEGKGKGNLKSLNMITSKYEIEPMVGSQATTRSYRGNDDDDPEEKVMEEVVFNSPKKSGLTRNSGGGDGGGGGIGIEKRDREIIMNNVDMRGKNSMGNGEIKRGDNQVQRDMTNDVRKILKDNGYNDESEKHNNIGNIEGELVENARDKREGEAMKIVQGNHAAPPKPARMKDKVNTPPTRRSAGRPDESTGSVDEGMGGKSGSPSPLVGGSVGRLSGRESVASLASSTTDNSSTTHADEEIERLLQLGERKRNSLTPLGSRSESMASVCSAGAEGRYGTVVIKGDIQLALQYNYKEGQLECHVNQCRDLAAVDTKRNRSDPYVKVYLLPDKSKSGKRKTKVKKHTLNPAFEEVLRFSTTMSELDSRTLWVSVWHSDMFGRNDFLGEVIIPLGDNLFDDVTAKWYPLQDRTEPMEELSYSPRGDLIIALKFVPPDAVSSKKARRSRGALHVLIKEAKSLAAVRPHGTADPVCKGQLLPEKGKAYKQKTSVCRKTLNPVWNRTLVFEDTSLQELTERSLELTVWDHDRLGSSQFLGGCRLNLGKGKHGGRPVEWMEAAGMEVKVWEQMLERPNLWVEGSIMLRPTMDKPIYSSSLTD